MKFTTRTRVIYVFLHFFFRDIHMMIKFPDLQIDLFELSYNSDISRACEDEILDSILKYLLNLVQSKLVKKNFFFNHTYPYDIP